MRTLRARIQKTLQMFAQSPPVWIMQQTVKELGKYSHTTSYGNEYKISATTSIKHQPIETTHQFMENI